MILTTELMVGVLHAVVDENMLSVVCLPPQASCWTPLLTCGVVRRPRPKMTALMGSSGAGKTTLLDVLAGRKTGGTTTGDIRLNGHPKLQSTFTRQDCQ